MSKTIHDVIRMARSLTDCPSALDDRDALIRRTPGLDLVEEGVLKDLGQKYPEPFKLTSVNGAVLQPTLKKLGLSYLNFAAIPQECKLRGSFYGYVDNFLSPPTIYYRSELRPCWKRFTIAKELLHLFSGTSIDKGVAEASILIMAAKSSRRLLVSETTELDDETFAFYLAIEVMIPWQLRYQFDRLRSMNATTLQMAKVFMVPERIVQHFLSDSADCHCNYAGLSRRINENI